VLRAQQGDTLHSTTPGFLSRFHVAVPPCGFEAMGERSDYRAASMINQTTFTGVPQAGFREGVEISATFGSLLEATERSRPQQSANLKSGESSI
jgi:hypothetical protein